ncbi:peptide ABC transporter substrate-binding protein [Aureimonas mangrovi]|uniref:peptide ABC transporter substrate-binding protein n=1 Tax=Aureimonas mangrovi TaxID=2758041 RepID=UPI00163D9EB3|nr:peptide ABC transporter substrate-binding protein [Aureimonas mangrovi]
MMRETMRALGLSTAILAAGAATAAPALAQEMVYNRGNDTDPSTLDHHLTSTVAEGHVMRDLYEGLVVQDATAEIVPGVAESWEMSDDGLVYTFRLREDARWSNGDPVTANDFVFAYRRIQDPATAAPYANIQYPIVNAEAVNSGDMEPDQLGVRAVDDRTLEITLHQPTPYFLELLTHQTGLPLHQASVEEFGDQFTRAGNMVTNGAYMLERFTPNDQIVLRKNPEFHDAQNVAIDVVNFIPFEDRATCLRRFEAGEVQSCSDLPLEQMAYMEANLGDQVRIAPYLGTYYLPVKTTKDELSDPRVRQAMSMAIDRDFLAQEIWQGAMVPSYSFVPAGIGNYGEPAELPYAGDDLLDREDAAIALLEEAGYGPGELSIRLLYNTSENNRNTMTAIADMLNNIGISAQPEEMEGTTYFNFLRSDGDFDVARAGWIGDYSDPQNFLFLNESENPGFNYSRWSNADYDALMEEAAAETDLDARAEILFRAETLLLDEVPVIPILTYTSNSLVSDRLDGWEDNIMNVHGSRWMSVSQ